MGLIVINGGGKMWCFVFIISAVTLCLSTNAMDINWQEKKLKDQKKLYLKAANQFFSAHQEFANTLHGQQVLECGQFAYDQAKNKESSLQDRLEKKETNKE